MIPDKHRFPILHALATDPDNENVYYAEGAEERIVSLHGAFNDTDPKNIAKAVQRELNWLADELKAGINAPGSQA